MITISSTPESAGTIDPRFRRIIDELAIECNKPVRLYVSKNNLDLVFIRWHSITPEVLGLITEKFHEIGWKVVKVHDVYVDEPDEVSGFCVVLRRGE